MFDPRPVSSLSVHVAPVFSAADALHCLILVERSGAFLIWQAQAQFGEDRSDPIDRPVYKSYLRVATVELPGENLDRLTPLARLACATEQPAVQRACLQNPGRPLAVMADGPARLRVLTFF